MDAQNCLGCRLARDEVTPPGGVIWRDHFWHLAHDVNNFIPGFLTLGSLTHVTRLYEIPAQDYTRGLGLIHRVREMMADQFSLKDFILFQNDHSSGHYHTWILPIYAEMQPFGRPPEGILSFLRWSKMHWNTPEKLEQINRISEILRQELVKSIV